MGQYSIYRKFYNFTYTSTGSTNTLINPIFLSANTFIAGSADTQSNTIIEQGLIVGQDQLGIFYVNLNPLVYSTDITYDLVWYVTYLNNLPNIHIHQLTTRFRINNVQYVDEIDIDIMNQPLLIEIIK